MAFDKKDCILQCKSCKEEISLLYDDEDGEEAEISFIEWHTMLHRLGQDVFPNVQKYFTLREKTTNIVQEWYGQRIL